MEYRVLGKTGLKVSRLGFGGIPIQRIDAEGTKALMHRLLEAGVNYIDSARGYTVSEEYIGYGLEGIRDKFILATKGRGLTKQAMQKDVETSLRNFRTDYIDLYQFHNPSLEDLETITAPGGALEALRDAKARRNRPAHRHHRPLHPGLRKGPGPWTGWRQSCSPTIWWKTRAQSLLPNVRKRTSASSA